MIVLHASFPLDPEVRDRALELADTLVEQSNQEDGIIQYRAAVDVDDENTLRFFEQYEDEDALDAHTETEHFREFERQLPDLLAGAPEVLEFDVDDATELEL